MRIRKNVFFVLVIFFAAAFPSRAQNQDLRNFEPHQPTGEPAEPLNILFILTGDQGCGLATKYWTNL